MKRYLLLTMMMLWAFSLSAQPHSVTLAWSWAQGTGDMATGFHIQRATVTGGPYVTVGTSPVATLSFIDTNVKAGDKWFYVVTAYNSAGDSVPSPEVSALIPFQIPQAPISPTATVK